VIRFEIGFYVCHKIMSLLTRYSLQNGQKLTNMYIQGVIKKFRD